MKGCGIQYGGIYLKDEIMALERCLAATSVMMDGKPVRLRLLTVHDKLLWSEFVTSCSTESLWHRFLSPFNATPERAEKFCNIDLEKELAIVAAISEDGMEKFIAVARLIRCDHQEEVEYAIIVGDMWQRRALGRVLSEKCVEVAKLLGVTVVNVEILRENFPMTKILSSCRFKMKHKEENMIAMSLKFK